MTEVIPLVPKTVILLGTDASGKNHVARLWNQKLTALGIELEVREGRLSAQACEDKEHGDKSGLSLFAERAFIVCFPLTKRLLPRLTALLLNMDARRFNQPKSHLLLVSHSALRILAFCLGQSRRCQSDQNLPQWLESAIKRIQEVSKAMVLVLDVADETRQRRICHRLAEGSIDPFDRFMAADSVRSERIEACLVDLAKRYYDAHLIENNDLDDLQLWDAFVHACKAHQLRHG